jgi:hypothetical protein
MKTSTPVTNDESLRKKPKGPTPAGLFWLLAKINSVTLGGGYVIVPVMATSLEKKGWMAERDLLSQREWTAWEAALRPKLDFSRAG